MNKKELYTSPEVNVLVVRFEGNIMTLSGDSATELGDYIDDITWVF